MTMKTSRRKIHSYYLESFGNLPPGESLPSEDDFSGNPTNNDGAFLEVVGFSDVTFTLNRVPTTSMQYMKVEVAENWELVTDLSLDGIEGTCLKVADIPFGTRVFSGILVLNGSFALIVTVLGVLRTAPSQCAGDKTQAEADMKFCSDVELESSNETATTTAKAAASSS